MFSLLTYKDTLVILRGLLILFITIMLGISVTEHQLNTLTERQDCVHAFDVNRDNSGVYSLYVLGCSYSVSAVYSVAEIINNNKSIIIKTPMHSLTIPTYVEVDCREELVWLDSWFRRLEEYAFKFKKNLEQYTMEIHKIINVYIGTLR